MEMAVYTYCFQDFDVDRSCLRSAVVKIRNGAGVLFAAYIVAYDDVFASILLRCFPWPWYFRYHFSVPLRQLR